MIMTMTMTTLFEDGSNMCLASGPAGMSDGVVTPRKASETWIGVERSWLGEGSGNTVRRQYVEIRAQVTSETKAEAVTNSALSHHSLKLMLNL